MSTFFAGVTNVHISTFFGHRALDFCHTLGFFIKTFTSPDNSEYVQMVLKQELKYSSALRNEIVHPMCPDYPLLLIILLKRMDRGGDIILCARLFRNSGECFQFFAKTICTDSYLSAG